MVPRGVRQHNPGNIRPGQGFRGEIGKDGGFAVFDTDYNGIRAIGIDLLTKMRAAIDTVREIVTRYAPPSENDTDAYIRAVCLTTGFKADDILNLNHTESLYKFVRAIIVHENGGCPYTPELVRRACSSAIMDTFGAAA